jgi:predicted RecB family nuclease
VTGALVWKLKFLSGVGSMTIASTAETLIATGIREVTELAAATVQDPEATQAALRTLVPSVNPVRITKS